MNQCNPEMCSRRDTCDKRECQPGVELQEVLKIPNDDFSKGIFVVMDMPAQIYRYVDYIGKKDVEDPSQGFTKEQYTVMLEHYGAVKGQQSGKALSIKEGRALYPVYSEIKKMLENADAAFLSHVQQITLSKKIRDHFEGEQTFAIPIYWGSNIIPLLIIFLKRNLISEKPKEKVKELVERELKDIKIIVKDTRLESLGKLVSEIPDKPKDFRGMFSRWLLGWQEERDGLWLGNKIWFVVDHGLVHAKNLWKLANDLAEEINLGGTLKSLHETNPLIFSLAVWLHDIGYKGIYLPTWEIESADTRLDHIIDNHGIISASQIINRKKAYNLRGFGDTVLARTGLICAYHQKESPIISSWETKRKSYEIPTLLKQGSKFVKKLIRKSDATIIPGDDYLILKNLCFKDGFTSKSLVVMASLLRLLDSCDFNRNRVGSPSMIKLREAVCDDNAKSLIKQFRRLQKESLCIVRNEVEKLAKNIHVSQDKQLILRKQVNNLVKLEQNKYIPVSREDLELESYGNASILFEKKKSKEILMDTFCHGRFIGLLKQQKSHYETHNSVKSVSFKRNGIEVNLVYEIDERILPLKTIANAEKIRKFVSNKTDIVYEKVLKEEQILKIKFVRLNSFTEEFDKWINKK